MDNSISFKGAFWIQQPTKSMKQAIYKKLGNKPQIFNNFAKEGDILYITEKSADKNIAKLLTHSKSKFKYYPELDTESGFSNNHYNQIMNVLNNYKSKIITNIEELEKIFGFQSSKSIRTLKNKDKTLAQTIKALNIDMTDNIIKRENGYSEIYTKDGDLVASISDPGLYGFRYARVEGDEVKRYAVRDGEIQLTYINNPDERIANGSAAFLKNYLKAVNKNKTTHI